MPRIRRIRRGEETARQIAGRIAEALRALVAPQLLEGLVEATLQRVERVGRDAVAGGVDDLVEPVLPLDEEAQPALAELDVELEQEAHPARQAGACRRRL